MRAPVAARAARPAPHSHAAVARAADLSSALSSDFMLKAQLHQDALSAHTHEQRLVMLDAVSSSVGLDPAALAETAKQWRAELHGPDL